MTQSKHDSYQPLQMLWPEQRLYTPPIPQVPSGCLLRLYQPGDELGFFRLMALVGWTDWNDEDGHPGQGLPLTEQSTNNEHTAIN